MMIRKVLLSIIVCVCILSFSAAGYTYEIKSGDTVYSIIKNTGISLGVLMDYNQSLSESNYLIVGKKLFIPSENSFSYRVVAGDTLSTIAQKYFTHPDLLATYNNIKNSQIIRSGQELKIPYKFVGACINKASSVVWPLVGYITSEYGYRKHPIDGITKFHSGIDIAAPSGTPVLSASSGTVIDVGYDEGYGKFVKVSSGARVYMYAHLNSMNVVKGYAVKQGEIIGRVGSTGISTGPHLHFQVEDLKGKTYDPGVYLDNIKYAYNLDYIPEEFKTYMGGK